MQSYQGGTLAIIGSVTQAMRAQKILSNAAIRADVVKTEGKRAHAGCIYAIAFAPSQENNVRTVLSNAGVRVREFVSESNR